MRWGPSVLLLAAALASPLRAWADPPRQEGLVADVQRASELFDEGRRLVAAGDCAAAIPVFQESIRHNDSVGARLNIASCTTSDPLAAWRELKGAELLARRKSDRRADEARALADALRPRLAMLQVDIPATSAAQLLVDATPVDIALQSEPVAVAPGEHALEVLFQSGDRWSGQASAVVGQVTVVRATPETTAKKKKAGGGSTLAYGLAGAGVIGLGVGTVLAIVAASKIGQAKDACTGYPACATRDEAARADPLNESGRSTAVASTIAFAIGGALVAGGVVVYVAGSPRTIAIAGSW